MKTKTIKLKDEKATLEFGAKLASKISAPFKLYLQGQLGAGKTTLVRGFLRALGHEGTVKSPTYTLVEPYLLQGKDIFHLDLYRLRSPEELEFIGIRDYFQYAICLLEWPENGEGFLPVPDLICLLEVDGKGRKATLSALTSAGEEAINA